MTRFTFTKTAGFDYAAPVSSVYQVWVGTFLLGRVAYCPTTREWLVRDANDKLWMSYGKTRQEAAEALITSAHLFS